MSKSIAVEIIKASGESLDDAAQSGLLVPKMIGIRSLIKAEDGSIKNLGLDIAEPDNPKFNPVNFLCSRWIKTAKVTYKGGSASITGATQYCPKRGWNNFTVMCGEENDVATQLMKDRLGAAFDCDRDTFYDDAILITKVRKRWMINPDIVTNERQIKAALDIITTRRRLMCPRNGVKTIVLASKPVEDELISLRLLFSS